MKKGLLIGALAIVGLISCFPTPYLKVDSITIAPSGVYAVEKLIATLHGEGAGTNTVTVYWAWSENATGAGEVIKTDFITINGPGNYSSTYSAGYGYVLVGYFWVEVYDEDDNFLGASSDVYCYYY